MELPLRPAAQDVCRRGVELRVQSPEVVVDRCGTEHAHPLALLLHQLEPLRLDDDAEALDKEDATEQRQQQLLMDDDGAHTDDAANGQRTGVAHEDLCRVGVVPQETYHSTDERRQEHHQLLSMGNVHNIEIGRVDDVSRHIGQDEQRYTDDGRVAGTHAVHTVVQVGTVRYCRHHEDGQDDEQHPSGSHLILA